MSLAASSILGSRRFAMEDQQVFAVLSGDANPLHMDRVAARRSVVGDVVVHGMHTVLWALEQVAATRLCPGGLSALDVRFLKPIYLDEDVTLRLQSETGDEVRLSVMVGEKSAAAIRLTPASSPAVGEAYDGELQPAGAPRDIAFTDLAGQAGEIPYAAMIDDFAARFPGAASRFGAAPLRDLAACSRLVGMLCPGLRSVFSRLTLNWRGSGAAGPLRYRVTSADARFSMVNLVVESHAINGVVQAFSPQPPPRQLTLDELSALIAGGDFSGQTALVIGGSRGLGELTAKAVAAGGGRVLITYAVGQGEAERVAEEIRAFGGAARAFSYDATRPAAEQLAALGEDVPSHLYYFATCQIFRAKTLNFDPALLARFSTFYVDGFRDLCQALWDRGASNVACFYPSSVAVEDRPKGMTEYAMAKAAGEILTADLGGLFPGYRPFQVRLPRLLTDQTSVVSPQKLPQSIDVLLPILRAMQPQ